MSQQPPQLLPRKEVRSKGHRSGLLLALGVSLILANLQVLAQGTTGVSRLLDLREASGSQSVVAPAAARYDIIALRVEFQPDTSRFSTGDGTFSDELFAGLQPVIDPFPHDADYFEAHLSFLRDYVSRVSDGKTELTTYLLPEVIRVSGTMGEYSPTGLQSDSPEERKKLARLVEEAWTQANFQSSFSTAGIDPDHVAFVLFHAGTGRDIELIGTSLDKTPEDLPSIFFNASALADLLPDPLYFKGLPVTHTAIVPETESKIGYNFVSRENYLLELSINGLLAASFFNYLGVPDLFNTATGESAIGGFGLMDAEGIFAYNGLFPPEPTAWTKYFLGWIDPPSLYAPQSGISLRATSMPGYSDAFKIPISSSEYYLIENRHRDPENDGITLQVYRDGEIVTQHFSAWQSDFSRTNTDAFSGGVVVGVDNYDWALPGEIDCNGESIYGGFLIWHVDENRLRAGLVDNSVNSNPLARAVDLEEGDSAQDIGYNNSSSRGTQYDYFFDGNPPNCFIDENGRSIGRYDNRFGPDTYPGTQNNAGSETGIVIESFSSAQPTATFDFSREATRFPARQGYEAFSLASGQFKGGWVMPIPANLVDDTAERAFASVSGTNPQGLEKLSIWTETDGVPSEVLTVDTPSSTILWNDPIEGDRFISVHVDGSGLVVRQLLPQRIPAPEWNYQISAPSFTIAGPIVQVDGSVIIALNNPQESRVLSFDGTFQMIGGTSTNDVQSVAVVENADVMIAGSTTTQSIDGSISWHYDSFGSGEMGQVVFGRDTGGTLGVLVDTGSPKIRWLLSDRQVSDINLELYTGDDWVPSRFPVLHDVDNDGYLDVVVTSGKRILAFSQGGALLRGFPIDLPEDIAAQPLIAEIDGESNATLLVACRDGYIYGLAITERGVLVDGFPLAVGGDLAGTMLVYDGSLIAVSESGSVFSWNLAGLSRVWWGQKYRDSQHSSFVRLESSQSTPVDALLIDAETYNWPNPAVAEPTFIRFAVSRDAEVQVTVIDLAGGLIADWDPVQITGPTPTEIEWKADVASGIYFARVTADDQNGQKEVKLIKIAVVK